MEEDEVAEVADVTDVAEADEGTFTWRVFVTLVTATALFFACFAALYDASVFWGPRGPSLGPQITQPH